MITGLSQKVHECSTLSHHALSASLDILFSLNISQIELVDKVQILLAQSAHVVATLGPSSQRLVELIGVDVG